MFRSGIKSAAAAKEPRLKRTLSHLAASWAKLASELETAQALRTEFEDKQTTSGPIGESKLGEDGGCRYPSKSLMHWPPGGVCL
jgi:hypothetical protein